MHRPDASAANADQVAFWNAAQGEQWVRHQAVMDRLLGPVDPLLLDAAGLRRGEHVLDVGCGTGAIMLQLADAVGAGGRVVGCDVSAPMLALARERLAGRDNVELLLADAQTHALPADGFDAVVSRFGVMFFDDPVAAFANLRRALRPGGRVAFVCWAPSRDNPFFGLPMQVAARRLGPVEPPPPRTPGPTAFADTAYVREILAGAGFGAVRIETYRPDLVGLETPAATADFVREMGPVARLLREREADETLSAAVAADLAEAFAPLVRDGVVRIGSCVYVVRAERG